MVNSGSDLFVCTYVKLHQNFAFPTSSPAKPRSYFDYQEIEYFGPLVEIFFSLVGFFLYLYHPMQWFNFTTVSDDSCTASFSCKLEFSGSYCFPTLTLFASMINVSLPASLSISMILVIFKSCIFYSPFPE